MSNPSFDINRFKDKLFQIAGIVFTTFGLLILLVFIVSILVEGLMRLDWQFITSLPSRKPEEAGIYVAILGSLWIMGLTALFAIPLGVASGIYLEEYGKKKQIGFID